MIVGLAFALYSAAVDPDDVLRVVRRLSVRSALTASLATRLVPLLGRDAERLAEAYELRAARPAGGRRRRARRAAILTRALAAGALERAVDLAAALEVRGYATAPRRSSAGTSGAPWSRHDFAFALAGLAMILVAVGGLVLRAAQFEPYPAIEAGGGPAVAALPLLVVAGMVAPFVTAAASRRRLRRGDERPAWGGEGTQAGGARA
jgi:energy-coupling factor transport system permease protein